MAGKGIIQINYEMPFEGMLVLSGVPKHQREKIFKQLGSNNMDFKLKTIQSYEFENVRFRVPVLSRDASKLIRTTAKKEEEWKPFDIEHLLACFMKSPKHFPQGLVYAVKRRFNINDIPHIFVMSLERGHANLELVKDDHELSHITSNFPKYKKIKIVD